MLDADVIIRGERGTLDLAAWMTQHEDEGFEVAAITVAELWHGVERASGGHRARREQYISIGSRTVAHDSIYRDNRIATRANMGIIGIFRAND